MCRSINVQYECAALPKQTRAKCCRPFPPFAAIGTLPLTPSSSCSSSPVCNQRRARSSPPPMRGQLINNTYYRPGPPNKSNRNTTHPASKRAARSAPPLSDVVACHLVRRDAEVLQSPVSSYTRDRDDDREISDRPEHPTEAHVDLAAAPRGPRTTTRILVVEVVQGVMGPFPTGSARMRTWTARAIRRLFSLHGLRTVASPVARFQTVDSQHRDETNKHTG